MSCFGNNSCIWIILLLLLFSSCGNSCGSCGTNDCGCNNNCGCNNCGCNNCGC